MRVICIDDGPNRLLPDAPRPNLVKWREYTVIREVETPYGIGVVLAEAEPNWPFRAFAKERFRPISEPDVRAMFRLDEREREREGVK